MASRERITNPTPAEIAASLQIINGPANLALCAIVATLQTSIGQINDWVDEHGDGCDCEFCAEHTIDQDHWQQGKMIEQDLRGLLWSIEHAHFVLRCAIREPKAEAAESDESLSANSSIG